MANYPTRKRTRLSFQNGDDEGAEQENKRLKQESNSTEYDSEGPPSKRTRGRKSGVQSLKSVLRNNSSKSAKRGKKSSTPEKAPVQRSEFQKSTQLLSSLTEVRQSLFVKKHLDDFFSLLAQNSQAKLKAHLQKSEENARNSLPGSVVPSRVSAFEALAQPASIKGKMKDYQLTGLSFLVYLHRNGINGILGDEMGLGKTLQTLSLLSYLKENQSQIDLPPSITHLIICPLSVISSWSTEVKRWTNLTHCVVQGSPAERKRLLNGLIGTGTDHQGTPRLDLIICNYETYESELGWFMHRLWNYVILDEGHRIKNHGAQISQSLQKIRSMNKLILTGTPIQNNLTELWSLLHWLLPKIFPEETLTNFKEAFNLEAGQYDTKFLSHCHRLLKLLMIRRTKEALKDQLSVPPREEITLYVPLSACQRFWIKRLLMRCDPVSLGNIFGSTEDEKKPVIEDEEKPVLDDEEKPVLQDSKTNGQANGTMTTVNGGNGHVEEEEVDIPTKYALEGTVSGHTEWARLMNLLMQLRKVCDHPYLMPNAEPEPFDIAEHLVDASSKLVLLDKLLESQLPQGKKILIFSQFTRMLDILEDFLTLRGIEFLRLDGSTPRSRRNLSIRLFQQQQTDDSSKNHQKKRGVQKYPIFLISTKAGGLGINLTAAETVILYDSNWNPQIDVQAIARAHRIGQTKNVTVYRLICHGSVEQQMLSRLRKKLYLSLKIMDSDHNRKDFGQDPTVPLADVDIVNEVENQEPGMSKSDIRSILRGGASALVRQWGKTKKIKGDDEQKKDTSKGNVSDEDEDFEDINSGYEEYRAASFEEIVSRAREVEKIEEVKINKDIDSTVRAKRSNQNGLGNGDGETVVKEDPDGENVEEDLDMDKKIEDEEMELLRGVEKVRTQILEGKEYRRDNNRAIGNQWFSVPNPEGSSKRIVKSTTKVIDGNVVDARSIGRVRWEAVPTITSNPAELVKLSSPKRTKVEFEHEDYCLGCHDGGKLLLCQLCPRVAHPECLGYSKADLGTPKLNIFRCTQHNCVRCQRNTTDSGGMLYRCQTCIDAYCEDCLPEENFYSVGDHLPEFLILGFKQKQNAHFIRCLECIKHFEENPETKRIWEEEEARIKRLYDQRFSNENLI